MVHFTLYTHTLHFTLDTPNFTLHTPHSLHSTPDTTLHTGHSIMYAPHSIYTLQSTHSTLYTLHFYTLHLLLHFSRVLASASWSPSCFRKVLGGMKSPIARNWETSRLTTPPQQQHRHDHRYRPSALRTLDSTLYIDSTTIHILHITLHNRHVALNYERPLHSTLYTSHLIRSAPHSTCYSELLTHFTLHTLHVTLYTRHVGLNCYRTLHSTLYTLNLYTPYLIL